MPKSKPTKAQTERYQALQDYGCMCCRKIGLIEQAEIHHITEGYRLGNDFTLPLCPWHHRGMPPHGFTSKKRAAKIYGPSLAENKKLFVEIYGTEKQLLEEINRWLNEENPQKEKARLQNESSLPF